MPAKTKKARKTAKEPPKPLRTLSSETQGVLLLSFALLLLLSLMSFALDPGSKNLLGLMGHTLGWFLHALVGLSSYGIVLYLGWMGWRLFFCKPLHFLRIKHLYVTVALVSLSLLLSLLESDAPGAAQIVGSTLYPGLWGEKTRYHLGGAPFFYLYRDLPAFNLHGLFNTVGGTLIFSSSLLASLFFLLKIRPALIYQRAAALMRQSAEGRCPAAAAAPPLEADCNALKTSRDTPSDEATTPAERSFLRFVKLRIPSFTHQESPEKSSIPDSASPNLLGIRPDRHLRERPSLSRKGLNEGEEGCKSMPPTKKRPMEEGRPDFQEEGRDAFKKPTDSPSREVSEREHRRKMALTAQRIHNGDFVDYSLPSPTLLTQAKKLDQSSIKKDLKRQAEVLEETLLSFGIEAKVGQVNCGPTIASFEVHPAIGVKVQKIKTLDNDIALNMEAKSIRIIAPIPGKAAVGIEVPNSQPQEVGFKDMLLAYQQGTHKFHIPILLGQAINGDYVMSDLTKMPHCIIAGATGSGKSVCINTTIMSILFNAKPNEIKLVMVDPKKVELTPYTRLPHMLAPVITESQGAAAALNWMVKEMEHRYEILKLVGVRNIEGFNKRTVCTATEEQLPIEIPAAMPYIVGIIDELADLMMVASQDIETPIARIAQMARAVGIHLILATQRPSREVITGLIKANFPTRISFKVASRINSQIILDDVGAESLLGNGDMLFLPPGSSHLTRAQGAFIRDEDIQSVVQFICEQAPPDYVIQSFDRFPEEDASALQNGLELDSLYRQAEETVLGTGNASTTFLQRKLKIGYARAASLMDQLEKQGVVGPAEGSRPRKIFARKKSSDSPEEFEEEDAEREDDEEESEE